jgi:hypothetical protein
VAGRSVGDPKEPLQNVTPGHFTSQRKVGLTVNSAPTKQS